MFRISNSLRLAFVLALGVGMPVVAQDAVPAFPLEGLRITGNNAIPGARIIEASGLKIGDKVKQADFDKARDRLLKTGAFLEVGYSYEPSAKGTGYDATFEVIELTRLYPYRFEELPLEEADLRAALRAQEKLFDDRIPATPEVMNRYAAALRRYIAEKTGEELEVVGELNNDLPGEFQILFRPAGERKGISSVDFTGNKKLELFDLRRAMAETAVGEPYSEGLFRRMLDLAIRPQYENAGYLGVTFPRIQTSPSTENKGLDVMVTIDEGPEFKIGKVTFNGLDRGMAAELERQVAFKTGAVYNASLISENLKKIRHNLENAGFLRAGVTESREIHDDSKTVDVSVDVDPGPRYSMGELTIKGLDLLSEPVIRDMWGMPQGAPYRSDYPDSFIQGIVDNRIFDNLGRTGAEADIHDDSLTVDVTLTFEGAKVVPPDQRLPRR